MKIHWNEFAGAALGIPLPMTDYEAIEFATRGVY
jgi:hypothetical protein